MFDALSGMEFCEKWIFWIKSLFSTMKAPVLVNGAPTEEFQRERGLRQGDPLSPSLFNIVGEVFHILMENAKSKGLIEGIRLSLTHLRFADDTILFLRPDVDNIQNLKRILQYFQIMSGLKIYFGKCSLYGWNEPELGNWARMLG